MFHFAFFLVTDADASIDAEKSDPVATTVGAFRIVQPLPPSPGPSDHPRQTQFRRDEPSQWPHKRLSSHVHFIRTGTLFLAGVGSFVSAAVGLHLTSVVAFYYLPIMTIDLINSSFK